MKFSHNKDLWRIFIFKTGALITHLLYFQSQSKMVNENTESIRRTQQAYG